MANVQSGCPAACREGELRDGRCFERINPCADLNEAARRQVDRLQRSLSWRTPDRRREVEEQIERIKAAAFRMGDDGKTCVSRTELCAANQFFDPESKRCVDETAGQVYCRRTVDGNSVYTIGPPVFPALG